MIICSSPGEVAVAGELAGVDFLSCKVGEIKGDFFQIKRKELSV